MNLLSRATGIENRVSKQRRTLGSPPAPAIPLFRYSVVLYGYTVVPLNDHVAATPTHKKYEIYTEESNKWQNSNVPKFALQGRLCRCSYWEFLVYAAASALWAWEAGARSPELGAV